MIKLVVTDLDGTLLTEKGTLSKETIDAVLQFKERAYQFTIATGRMDTMAELFVKQLAIDLPIIACNGALVIHPISKEIIFKAPLNLEESIKLIEIYLALNLDFLFYTHSSETNEVKIFHRSDSRRMKLHRYYNKLCKIHGIKELDFVCIEDLPQTKQELEKYFNDNAMDILKFFVKHEDLNKVKEATQKTHEIGEFSLIQSWNGSFDVMKYGIDKGVGLTKLAQYLKLDLQEIASFGDQYNDHEMLAVSGRAYAVKSGEYTNIEGADYIAESHKAEGVARTLIQDFSKHL